MAGMLGVGGGLILIPALFYIFSHYNIIPAEVLMHFCIASSLAIISITSIASVLAHQKHHVILWDIFKSMLLGIILGALFLGPLLVNFFNTALLKVLFSIFCLLTACQMIIGKTVSTENKHPSKVTLFLTGTIIGVISTLLGIAGGVLSASFLNWYKFHIKNVIGTTAAIGLMIAIFGTIGMIFSGTYSQHLKIPDTLGYIYLPAVLFIALPSLLTATLGAKLSHKLPVKMLKKIFAAFLLIVGLKMLFS